MAQETMVCIRLLNKTMEQESYSNLALDAALRESTLSKQEKGRCAALYYGVIERKITLDFILSRYSKKPPHKLDLPVLNLLRCGIYQLLYMRIPDNAAVNEIVSLTKKLRFSSASGFVNAVLRQFIRDGKEIKLPDNPVEADAIRYSAPAWLIRQLSAEYGDTAMRALLSDAVGKPPVTIRRNPLHGTDSDWNTACQALGAQPHPLLPDCYTVASGDVTAVEAFSQGLFHVQDLASQLCCHALGVQMGDTVLDVCAAPGGKSFTLAQLLQGTGMIHAFDLYPARVKLIADGASRLQLPNLSAQVGDATVYRAEMPLADKILCDVPCSGLGVVRRKPEIKYKDAHAGDTLPEIQARILETAAQYLRVGGELVYSTCTVSRRENDAVVDAFLEVHPNFIGIPYLETLGAPFGTWKTTLFPDQLGSDGFFIAKLKRMG